MRIRVRVRFRFRVRSRARPLIVGTGRSFKLDLFLQLSDDELLREYRWDQTAMRRSEAATERKTKKCIMC